MSCWKNNAVEPEEAYQKNEDGDPGIQVASSKSRSCTDIFFLILLIAFTCGLVSLIGYCMYHGDIYRILNGYDDCANVCGRANNEGYEEMSSCKKKDMTFKRLLVISMAGGESVDPNQIHRQCVDSCDPTLYEEFFNKCVPKKSEKVINKHFSKTGLPNFFQEVSEDFHLCWREILVLCIIPFVFSGIMLVLFRYAAGFVVWLVLAGVMLTTIIGTIYLWIMWHIQKKSIESTGAQDNISNRSVTNYLAFAIIATIVTIIVLLVLLVMRKRINLVIQLFKEAGKAIGSMPLLLLEPVLTFAALATAVGLWIYFSLWVESSGYLVLESNQSIHYRKDTTMKVTRWYNLFALFWFTQFIIGCQHMVIAGAVATWFFTRNKNTLNFPIMTSFKNLLMYHMGSVAFGSLIIGIIQFLKVLLSLIKKRCRINSNVAETCVKCCCCENFIKYLNTSSYIETSIHGYSFCKGGKEALKILYSNALRVIAINSVGDFILLVGKVFVVTATVLIGFELIQKKEGVQNSWVMLTVVGLIAYFTSHCFMTVYEMAIDTIFICFCEDCKHNDGVSRPYYMSRGLMEFVKNSKKAVSILDESDSQAWSGPRTISQNVDK